MTSDNWLAIFILSIFALSGYMIITKPKDDKVNEDD